MIDLRLGDCLKEMKYIKSNSIDAIVTDPPFSFAGGLSNGATSMVDSQFFSYWWKDVAEELNRILRPDGEGFLWCDWHTAPVIESGFIRPQKFTWRLASLLYHYREMPGMGKPFRSSVDTIAYLRGPKSDGHRIPNTTQNWISKYWYYGKHENHPAEKDIDICKLLLGWCSDENMTIIDPFMGSGTTGKACIETNRNFVGIEIDKHYFEIAQKRITEAQMQLRLAI